MADVDPRVRRNRAIGLIAAALVFILDQATKYVVTVPLQLQERETLELLPFFDLNWTENRGVSMGFLTADSETMRWLLVGLTGAIALFVAAWMWREKRPFWSSMSPMQPLPSESCCCLSERS
jgi:signal peptidase II